MKQAKIFIAFTFLLAFVFQVSAQEQKPKIVWKNLQPQYEKFEHIKPSILNQSDYPIYFDCSFPDSIIDKNYRTMLWKFDESTKAFHWNVMVCGTRSKEEIKAEKREAKRIEKLRKQGKYIEPEPSGCKLDPNEEFVFNLNKSQWESILLGDFENYTSGRFKFNVIYETQNNSGIFESPEFLVIPREETK